MNKKKQSKINLKDNINMRLWVKTWKNAGRALNKIKKQELQSYSYKKNQLIIDEMLQWAVDHGKVRRTSGLIEQQYYFTRMRESKLFSSKI